VAAVRARYQRTWEQPPSSQTAPASPAGRGASMKKPLGYSGGPLGTSRFGIVGKLLSYQRIRGCQNDARIRSALGARRPLCRGPGAGGDHRGTWIAAGLLPLQRGKRRRTEAVPQSGGGITARRTECRLRTLNQPQHPAVRREITVRLGPTQRGKRRQANRQTGDNGCQPDRCNGDNGSRPAVATADNGGRDCAATKDRRQSGLPTTHVVGVL